MMPHIAVVRYSGEVSASTRKWAANLSLRKLGTLAAAGILFGSLLGLLASRKQGGSSQPKPTIVESLTTGQSDELARLKARNRRLEALVSILKAREEEGKRKPK